MKEVEQIQEEEESEVRCERCGHEWIKRGDTVGDPEICPRCKSARWHTPRKPKGANNKK